MKWSGADPAAGAPACAPGRGDPAGKKKKGEPETHLVTRSPARAPGAVPPARPGRGGERLGGTTVATWRLRVSNGSVISARL